MDSSARVQHVTKASSDELLRKFAESDSDCGDEAPAKKKLRVSVPRKRAPAARDAIGDCRSPINVIGSSRWMERRSLLPRPPPPQPSQQWRSPAVLWQMQRAREIKNKSILGMIGKTWCRTVKGASKVFVEKHYNRHRRLINDAV